MWNYRVVRKKYELATEDDENRSYYQYAIHEAYYDNNGKVGSITQEPIIPSGENIEELRHSWLIQAEAFGQPILDFDNIPEEGYRKEEDHIATTIEERLEKIKNGTAELIPLETVKKELEDKFGPINGKHFREKIEKERLEKEKVHINSFEGKHPIEKLIQEIYADYSEFIKRDKIECPWNYK